MSSFTNWYVQRERFIMAKGNIMPDVRGGCPCGGKFSNSEKMDIYDIPKCAKCGKFPSLFRVARYLPIVGQKHIRYYAGKRLDDPFSAICCMRRIDEELESGTFKVKDYLSVKELERRTFSNFIKGFLSIRQSEVEAGKRSSEGERKFTGLVKNHLSPYFEDFKLDAISSAVIVGYKVEFKGSEGQFGHSISALKTILKDAYQLDLINSLPSFPKIKKTKHRKNNFIDIATQQKIICQVKDPIKRKALQLTSVYGLRACEIRAIQWRDIDFKKEVITIQRHFSGKQLLDGRKSQSSNCPYGKLKLPFIKLELMEGVEDILSDIPRSIRKNSYIFQSSKGEPLGERELSKQWNNACKAIGLKDHVDMYSGTKHATASSLFRLGVPLDVVREMLGHTSISTTERYAKSSVDHIKQCVVNAYSNDSENKVIDIKRDFRQ